MASKRQITKNGNKINKKRRISGKWITKQSIEKTKRPTTVIHNLLQPIKKEVSIEEFDIDVEGIVQEANQFVHNQGAPDEFDIDVERVVEEANPSGQVKSEGAHGSDHFIVDSDFVANFEASTSLAPPQNLSISETNFEASTSCALPNLSVSGTNFEDSTNRASPNLLIFDNFETSTSRASLNSDQIFVTNTESNDASQNLPDFHDDLGKIIFQFIKDKDNFMSNLFFN